MVAHFRLVFVAKQVNIWHKIMMLSALVGCIIIVHDINVAALVARIMDACCRVVVQYTVLSHFRVRVPYDSVQSWNGSSPKHSSPV